MLDRKIILASSSPRRHELLKSAKIEFEVIKPTFDESTFEIKPEPKILEQLSLLKAKSITKNLSVSALVISADTVVILDDKIMGKPKDFDDALTMWNDLNGKTHKVITSICILDTKTNKEYLTHDTTYVTFNTLTECEIVEYIQTKKPFDKAGAYGIQEIPKNFVKFLDGEFDNVMGLPTKILINILKTII